MMVASMTATLVVEARARVGAFELDARFTASGVTVLFGPTASGKSLTLRVVAGVEPGASASITLGESRLDGLPPRARSLGWAPQDAALWHHRKAFDHLTPFTSRVRAMELLALVGLERHAERKPERLSGGERQRLAFARSLAREPKILLLDEPFSALDDEARARMGDVVRDRASRGAIVLFVTHDRAEAARLGTHFVLFDEGRTRESDALNLPQPAE